MSRKLKAPFIWFGGKSRVADLIWKRFGSVRNYVEPFFGSGAVLLARPQPFDGTETVNDKDGLLCNFWRAVKADPDAVAEYADWPVNECDLTSRHIWLVNRKDSLQSRLEGDPDYFDAKVAGWWCWGLCCWIGGGWCSGEGPWSSVDGELVKNSGGKGVNHKRLNLNHLGNGVHQGVHRTIPSLRSSGSGVHRQMPMLGVRKVGAGVNAASTNIIDMMTSLASRLRRVRVCCGDWSRVCGPTPTIHQGLTSVFLDPPYSAEAGRDNELYMVEDASVAHDARKWAIEWGEHPMMRICLAGYEGEHEMPDSWECVAWKTNGGYANQGEKSLENRNRERLWFSPNCIRPYREPSLFDIIEGEDES